ncbi:MAG: hypothetical protein GWN29_02190 [Gammaproteobacteria bacterium]|nr:hypothetical protein [Gammaproteobacteria bacterium]
MNAMLRVVALAALAPAAFGHHSDAGVDMTTVVEFDGTVTSYVWRNPHVYFNVVRSEENGQTREWQLQMPSTNTMTRMGWSPASLVAGDEVTVYTHVASDGRPYGILEYATKADGTVLATSFDYDSGTVDPVFDTGANPATDSIEGIWIADRTKLTLYPGGFDGFFRAQLSLTEAGAEAQASFDELSDENPESTCIGRPTPAMIVSTTIFPIQIEFNEADETVMIRTELYDEERTVYMDGRSHPEPSDRFVTGHSIGHWDGDTLVVDTANFIDHRSPYQIGVPSSGQKHVVERYRLGEDGTRIIVDFTLEDPVFLAEPLTHSRELIYSPELEINEFNCDPETTRRFVIPR